MNTHDQIATPVSYIYMRHGESRYRFKLTRQVSSGRLGPGQQDEFYCQYAPVRKGTTSWFPSPLRADMARQLQMQVSPERSQSLRLELLLTLPRNFRYQYWRG